jgi:branched-chain amino acid transport system permease protein
MAETASKTARRSLVGHLPRLTPAAWKAVVVILFLVITPAFLWASGSGYMASIAVTTLIFIILSVSLNHVCGAAGLLSLGHAGFYGIGAYAAALLAREGWPFLLTVPSAGVMAGLAGILVALPTMRLVSIYFAVATLGIGEMIHVGILNWVGFTRGPMGIRSIPPINLFGVTIENPIGEYYVVAVVALISIWVIHRMTHSYYGNALRALREDDQCADAMGLNVVRLKIQVFGVSCFFAGVAGALFAHTANFISPDSFRFTESILILSMIVVGGLGSIPGSVIGGLLMILLPEILRDIGDVRMVVVGSVMFICILVLPRGLFGEISALELMRRQFGQAWPGGKAVTSGEIGWK